MEVSTRCAHCPQTLDLTIDSDMKINVRQDTEPMIFVPEVSFFELEDPSIIDAF